MSIDPKYGRYCDECGRIITKAHRIFEGNDYCGICYPRVFVSKPCTNCGGSARVHRLAPGPPVCRSCRCIGRICVRCEKPIIKAGMISAGKPVCPSCVPHFKSASHCTACGTLSSRLSAMPSAGIFEKICGSCRTKITHKTCNVCRKYRKVAGVTPEGKPFCPTCQPGTLLSHFCPDCGTVVSGSGTSKCRPCLNRSQLYHEVELTTLILIGDWTKTLYRQFAEWLYNRQSDSPNLMKVFRAHQAFFERIDTEFFHLAEISAPALLQTFGTAGLRKHLLVTRFLAECLSLVIAPEEKAENADLERIRTKLLENKKQPWGEIITGYAESLLNAGVSIRTRRMYVAAAEAFCQFAKPSIAPWSEDRVHQFLRKKPGLRANLSIFVGYCGRAYNWEVTMPPRGPERIKLSASPSTVPHLRKLLQKVAKEGLDKVNHGTLARIIAKCLGFPIKTILGISSPRLSSDLGRIILEVEGEPVVIPAELDDVVHAFIARH